MECPICLEVIGDTNVMTTACGHTFHTSCMIQNLRVSAVCPICRGVVDHARRNTHSISNEGELIFNFTEYSIETGEDILNVISRRNMAIVQTSNDDVENSVHTRITEYINEVIYDLTHMMREWTNEDDETEPVLLNPLAPPFELHENTMLYNNNIIDTNNYSRLSLEQVEMLLMND